MAAQNQHYVPKFILRNFLSNERRQQVTVFDKKTEKIFRTSIANIMAERRFNDFNFEEFVVSFEEIATRIEQFSLPVYRKILQERRLPDSPQERAEIAFLLSFQFVRTRAHRDRWKEMTEGLRNKLSEMGMKIEDIEGYTAPDENTLKKEHLLNIRDSIAEFAPHFVSKNFVLMSAPSGHHFYIGDNPVVLNNMNDLGPYGNIGLAVRGIEIYLPLAADLVLCAFCPSIYEDLETQIVKQSEENRRALGVELTSGRITVSDGLKVRQALDQAEHQAHVRLSSMADGGHIEGGVEQVEYVNSLQTKYASRFVICKNGNLRLAKRFNREFPKFKTGVKIEIM